MATIADNYPKNIMEYYSIQNPLGSILYFVDSYCITDKANRKNRILSWFQSQSPSFDLEKRTDLYNKYNEQFNLDIELIDVLFQGLGWATYYFKPLLSEKIKIAQQMGLILNSNGRVALTKLGKHLFETNTYNEYVNSINHKANFWKKNNVKITDNEDIGSGFFIEPNIIVTCKHVYEGLKQDKIIVEDENGIRYNIKRIIKHPLDNVDILKLVTVESFDFFTYAIEENITITEKVIVFGYPPIPLSSKPFLMANLGEVSSIVDNYLDDTDCLILSCILRPGNSGGPIINENGKLIGISIQNRFHKFNLTSNNGEFDLNKGLGFATGLIAKYINEF